MKYVELNGEIVGVVEYETEKTLLIRKGYLQSSGEQIIFLATEKAVFISKELVNHYWIKLVGRSYIIETINIVSSRQLVRKFFNM
ncbi:hypothetical protein ACOMN8_000695 [Enterococcus faecalis]|uniref:hypothetical protein n=1 Tax=Enterococcus faecalis TaxID=1351 RepID=UPI0010C209E5|nr:hypothetical protein [Enterococcus faecalis]TKN05904.1 hypothetical protein DVW77_00815 [Enterococcus faecalis]